MTTLLINGVNSSGIIASFMSKAPANPNGISITYSYLFWICQVKVLGFNSESNFTQVFIQALFAYGVLDNTQVVCKEVSSSWYGGALWIYLCMGRRFERREFWSHEVSCLICFPYFVLFFLRSLNQQWRIKSSSRTCGSEESELWWLFWSRYMEIMKRHELQISQPAVDGATSWPITIRRYWTGKEVHKHTTWEGLIDNCTLSQVTPPCAGYIIFHSPRFSIIWILQQHVGFLLMMARPFLLRKRWKFFFQICWDSSTSICK